MFLIEARGEDWIGVKFSKGRGIIKVAVIGHLSALTASRLGSHVADWARKHPRHPVLVDCSEAYAPPTALDGTIVAMCITSAVGRSSLAIVGGSLDQAVAKLPESGGEFAWFSREAGAKRWLPVRAA